MPLFLDFGWRLSWISAMSETFMVNNHILWQMKLLTVTFGVDNLEIESK